MDNKLDFEESLDLAEKIYGYDHFMGMRSKETSSIVVKFLAMITRNGRKSNKI